MFSVVGIIALYARGCGFESATQSVILLSVCLMYEIMWWKIYECVGVSFKDSVEIYNTFKSDCWIKLRCVSVSFYNASGCTLCSILYRVLTDQM